MKNTILVQLISLLFIISIISSCDKSDIVDSSNNSVKIRFNMNNTSDFIGSNTKSQPTRMQKNTISLGNGVELILAITEDEKSDTRAATTLKDGTKYRMLVYCGNTVSGNPVLSEEFTVGVNFNNDFVFEGGQEYTFVFYSYNKTGDLPEPDNFTLKNVDGDSDLLYYSVSRSFVNGTNPDDNPSTNILDITFAHKFSRMKIVFESEDETKTGNITSIGSISFSPHFSSVDFNLATNKPAYKGAETTKTFVFPSLNTPSIESEYELLCANTQAGIIHINSITSSIMGTASNIPDKTGIEIAPGKSYTVTYTLKKGVIEGFDIGGVIWASGNLILRNGVYGFEPNQGEYGDYWFPGYSKPKKIGNHDNQESSLELNGPLNDDPCSLVGGGWRLPTATEFSALIASTDVYQGNNYVNQYAPNRLVAFYDDQEDRNGLYFGTQSAPATSDANLFFPFAGRYDDNDSGTNFNDTGVYMLTGIEAHEEIQLTGIWGCSYITSDTDRAISIRCVKDK